MVPLDDPLASAPLIPGGISQNTPEAFGLYAHVWSQPDGIQVLQYYGDFSLHLGERRLKSQDSVIWMQKSSWEATQYYHYEVYLSGFASVREAADTVTTGPVLFVTFNSTQALVPEADVFTGASSEETPLYQEATRIRQSIRAGAPPGAQEFEVTRPGQPIIPRPKARPIVRYSSRDPVVYDDEAGVLTATGDVHISQGLLNSDEFLEIRANAAVLFLARRDSEEHALEAAAPPTTGPAPALEPFPAENAVRDRNDPALGSVGFGDGVGGTVTGAYLQGDVVLTRGDRMIRASELYYDFENDRALILDAVMRAVAPGRNLPIYVRADQVRQLSTTEYFARKAAVTTSEFYTPHVHIGADRVYLTDATPRDEAGRITNFVAGRYRMYDTTVNVEGVPVLYWPYTAGDFRQTESPLQNVRMGYSDDFGATFQSKWYLFNLLGLERPQGVEALLRLDYFSERGPGAGLDVDYETEDSYGLFRGYYIHDTGSDNLGPFRDNEPDTENRGRFTLRHRQFLPDNWQLTVEASYVSDPTFLEEYFNAEFEEGKEQETLLYLKKQEDNWAFSALAQWRVLDFLTQTEHLPDTAFHWIGEPLAEIASFYSESRLGFVRYKPDDRRVFDDSEGILFRSRVNTYESDLTFRGTTRNEIDLPIKLGDGNIVPFIMGRTGYWDNSAAESALGRAFGQIGVRMGTQFWRLFENVISRLFDVDGVRHVVRPQATAWLSASNVDSIELFPFDQGVETVDDFYGTSLALRQAWQTKRGPPGATRIVDWMIFDIELNLFGDTPRHELPIGRFYDSRPENSIARNHVRTDFIYRISDTTAILSESNWDLTDGSMDLFNLSYAVERTPRFSYFVGYRRIGDTESNLLGAGMNYELNVKHRLALRGYYDLDRGEMETFDVTVIRKWPRWYTAVTFGLNNIEEDIGLSFSIWPEGAPTAVIGGRRYTSVAESTGIRPED
ncbi:MAG: hypothetical protein AMXMBFR13_10800 [Phycisphaerae bacterium]